MSGNKNSDDSFRKIDLIQILEAVPVAVSWANLKSQKIEFINRKFTEIFGYVYGDHRTVEEWITGTYVKQDHIDRAIQTWVPYFESTEQEVALIPQVEVDVQCKDGSIKNTVLEGIILPELEIALAVFTDVTLLIESQLRIRTSEEQLRQFYENRLIGMYITGPDNRFIRANDTFCRLIGYSLDELRHITLQDLVEKAEIGMQHTSTEAGTRRDAFISEMRYVRKDGQILYLLESTEQIRDPEGSLDYRVAFVQDITQRKQQEEVLNRYAQIVASSTDLILLVDRNYTYLAVNAAVEEFFQKPMNEIVGHTVSELMGEEFFNRIIKPRADRCLQGENINLQEWLTFPVTNERRFVDIHYYPYRDRQNGIMGYVVNNRDITEQKLAEEALRKSEEKFFKAVNSALEAVVITRLDDGLIFYVNPGFERILGFTAGESIGKTSQDLNIWIAPEHRAEFKERLKTSGEVLEMEVVNRKKSGEVIPVSISATVTEIDNELCIVCWSRDLSRQKEEEQRRQEMENHLAEAQKMESVVHLTGGIAHDFNNILAIIRGNLDLLRERLENDPKSTRYVRRSIDNIDRGRNLIQQLLAFSSKQMLAPQNFDMRKLVDGMSELLRSTLGESIDLEIVHEQDLWTCYADIPQVENCLINLVLNSRDAMPEGGKLTLYTANVQRPAADSTKSNTAKMEKFVMLTATDTGTGMDEETRGRIFEPFFTTKEQDKGTGLGMSMVYGFVKQSDGFLEVDSQPGEGTEIRIGFPHRENGEIGQDESLGASGEFTIRQSETILVVEDEPDLLEVISEQLKSLGYRVYTAGNGSEALAMETEIRQTDLLLTDIILPGGMMGPAVAEEVRKINPDIRVLYMSGYTEDAVLNEPDKDQQQVLMLKKPFTRKELNRMIQEVLLG